MGKVQVFFLNGHSGPYEPMALAVPKGVDITSGEANAIVGLNTGPWLVS